MENTSDSHHKFAFVHVVLFKCPGSGEPLTATFLSSKKNLEEVDSHSFNVRCSCGWSGNLFGIAKINSWVEKWGNGQ
jgi:hypothetical protein